MKDDLTTEDKLKAAYLTFVQTGPAMALAIALGLSIVYGDEILTFLSSLA